MGLNSRYVGNDTVLLMERAIQDLGAGVKFLRAAGYERVVLIGNSGGAALASFYQAQAEQLTAHEFPDGDPTHLHADDLPPVDGIALCAAHEGRSKLLRRLDRSLGDRRARSALGGPGARHVRPAPHGALQRRVPGALPGPRSRRGATASSSGRSSAWNSCAARPARRATRLSSSTARMPIRAASTSRSMPTTARRAASGATRGRSTIRATRWGAPPRSPPSCRNGRRARRPTARATWRAPRCRCCCSPTPPTRSTFPSTRDAWLKAGGTRIRNVDIVGGNHYLAGQPALVPQAADAIAAWAEAL